MPLLYAKPPVEKLQQTLKKTSPRLKRDTADKGEIHMQMNFSLAPLVSLIAGILILVAPRLLNYIVAIYLIVIGIIGLFGGNFHMR